MRCGHDHAAGRAGPREAFGARATPATARPGCATVHVAAVYGVDGVTVLTAASSRDGLYARLSDHVRRQVDLQLYPDEAGRVRRLLETGRLEAAVRRYFASVGKRWDQEWLVTDAVELTRGRADLPRRRRTEG